MPLSLHSGCHMQVIIMFHLIILQMTKPITNCTLPKPFRAICINGIAGICDV